MNGDKMTQELLNQLTTCPVCGNPATKFNISLINLDFLQQRLDEKNLDEAIVLSSVAWTNFPTLKLSADSKSVVNSLLKGVEEQISAALKPLNIARSTINPLIEKLESLIENLPQNLQGQFKNIKTELNERLESINQVAANSSKPVQEEIKELALCINTLISKPTSVGTLNEETLRLSWDEFFVKDKTYRKGYAGKPDLIVLPFVERNGVQVGQKIVIERKAGRQKYSGVHLQEAINHTRAEGAHFGMLIYDAPLNLVDSQKPFFITMAEGIVLAVADIASGSWRIGREIFEILQLIVPNESALVADNLRTQEIQNIIDQMININAQIESLRKLNNSTLTNCDRIRLAINQLEQAIVVCQQRLKTTLQAAKSPNAFPAKTLENV